MVVRTCEVCLALNSSIIFAFWFIQNHTNPFALKKKKKKSFISHAYVALKLKKSTKLKEKKK